MIASILRPIVFALVLLPALAAAEPITLTLSFFSSNRSHLYLSGAKPFVDAVNEEGAGRVKIEVHFNSRLGGLAHLSQFVRNGRVDIGYVIPPYESGVFPDASVMELPGLYKNATEASKMFAELVARGAIRAFEDFYVIGAFTSEPESIHTRPPVVALADLKGKRIRANNQVEIDILNRLGAKPAFIPIAQTAQAIMRGEVDGAMVPPAPMFEFGIGRVAPYHYFLRTSCVPQVLLMSRKRFDSLPADVQALIRKHSGAWFMDRYIKVDDAVTARVMHQLETDPRRKVIFPSPAVQRIYQSLIDAWATKTSHNRELPKMVETEPATIRANRR